MLRVIVRRFGTRVVPFVFAAVAFSWVTGCASDSAAIDVVAAPAPATVAGDAVGTPDLGESGGGASKDPPLGKEMPAQKPQSPWESFFAALEGSLGLLVPVLGVLGGLPGVYLLFKMSKRRDRVGSFWKIYPLLRPQGLGAEAVVSAHGRVPLAAAFEGSVVSHVWNYARRLMLRPSSPKSAFAVRACARSPRRNEQVLVNRLPARGFRLRVDLHPHESAHHLRRSFDGTRAYGGQVLAVCEPAELERPTGRVACYLVDTTTNDFWPHRKSDTSTVLFCSADPLWHSLGNEWISDRDSVDDDAIWLIYAPESRRSGDECPVERETVAARDMRIGYLRQQCLWLVFLPFIGLGFLSAILVPLFAVGGSDDQFVRDLGIGVLTLLWTAYLTWLVLVVFLLVIVAANHGWSVVCHESNAPRHWRAGTTGCLHDALIIRNGRTPDPQSDQ